MSHTISRTISFTILFTAIVQAAACSSPSSASSVTTEELRQRGKDLVALGGCNHCHTPMYFDAKVGMPVPDATKTLAGHPEGAGDPQATPGKEDQAVIGPTFTSFRAPFGVVYAANLTPDATGLGDWTEREFIATMRTGHRKGTGRILLPPMPWENLRGMSDDELRAIFLYLRSLPPVKNVVPPPQVAPETIRAIDESFAKAGATH